MTTKRRKGAQRDTYAILGLVVSDFQVRCSASTNTDIDRHYPDPADPVFRNQAQLEIAAICIYPDERAGPPYSFTLYDAGSRPGKLSGTVGDYHARNQRGERRYRTRGGLSVPVYELPEGIGLLERERGKESWTAWAEVAPELIATMLTSLYGCSKLYISLTERKVGRARWIKDFTLQTTNPEEE